MIIVLEILAIVGGAALIGWWMYLVGKHLLAKHRMRSSITPLQAQNLNREKDLLTQLLKDIQINTNEWFVIDDAITMGQGRLLANDKKNVGIVYGNGAKSATILLNLDKLNEGFIRTNEDTVKMQVSGSHVKNFLDKAEHLIDKRGNEISFFKSEIEKRL